MYYDISKGRRWSEKKVKESKYMNEVIIVRYIYMSEETGGGRRSEVVRESPYRYCYPFPPRSLEAPWYPEVRALGPRNPIHRRIHQVTLQILGIKMSTSTTHHPQSDGQTERANQELEQYLQSYINKRQDNWDTVRGLTLRYPPIPSASEYLRICISISLSIYLHFIVHTYFHPPIGSSVGPYHIHTFILRFIFDYCMISIYIISRTFYSLP